MDPAQTEDKQELLLEIGDITLKNTAQVPLRAGGLVNLSQPELATRTPQEKRLSNSPDLKPQDTKISQAVGLPLKPNSAGSQSNSSPLGSVASPSVINKQLLSKLNKSLKEKQKVITQSVSHPKTPNSIQDVLSTSPKFNAVVSSNLNPGIPSNEAHLKGTETPEERNGNTHIGSEVIPPIGSPNISNESGLKIKAKNKRIAKQNSTRTDFFAAKLASAVDDVESSDSDGTFVYETNAPEIEDDADNSGAVGTEIAVPLIPNTPSEDLRGAENINNAPASIHLVNDNISFSGSYKGLNNDHFPTSPVTDLRKNADEIVDPAPPTATSHTAESVISLQSSKQTLGRACNGTPPLLNNGKPHPNLDLSFSADCNQYSDPFLDNVSKYSRHPTRKNSNQSIFSEDNKDPFMRSPKSPFRNTYQSGPVSSLGMSDHAHNISEPYPNAMYCYREEDVSGDESSFHGDNPLISGAPHRASVASNVHNKADETSRNKPQTTKTSSTSSKLRSTTSKLFDRKGAQPRRYSTIPDDIDIEDFDDELIYYDDNNVRFPYNKSLHAGLNESSSLIGDHKLPHYKSLNLSYAGKRVPSHLKSKRYLSLGYVPPLSHGFGPKKIDQFPFPYPQNGDPSYFGFRECEEEPHQKSVSELQSVENYHPSGLPPFSINRQLLNTKGSHDTLNGDKYRLMKNVLYTLVCILGILSFGFVLGFLFASAKDLSNLSILSIENALVSLDELVFSVVVEALNPGWFTVTIDEIELDIFAKSGYLDDLSPDSSVETVLLGSVLSFESAIDFEGSFFNRTPSQQTGEIKLIGPGKNLTGAVNQMSKRAQAKLNFDPTEPSDNAEKWKSISKHPFDLILRGVLKYKLAINHNFKSVVVNKVGYIDPS